jgi:hypothetical protein
MRRHIAIAGLLAVLPLGSAPAFAFQEQPVPPPSAAAESTPEAKAAPLQLATPGVTAGQKADPGGLKVFGRNLFPKLNFGLELLYGQDEQQLQLEQGPSFDDTQQDVTVLGKVKRHF